jgi:hypothetical protein
VPPNAAPSHRVFCDTFAPVDNYDAMVKALAERNRRSRRMYTILIPIAIAGLVASVLLRVVLRSSMKPPRQPPAATSSW